MISQILKADSVTGWVPSAGSEVVGVTQESVANNNTASVILKFGTAIGENQTYEFEDPIDCSGYTDLVFHVEGRNFMRQDYRVPADFAYKIELGTGKAFYLKVFEHFCDVTINLTGITTIEEIKITKLVSGEDYLVVSSFVLHKQQLPLDLFVGMKDMIEHHRDIKTAISVGTASVTAGDTKITFSTDVPYIDRYAVIKLTDGSKTEYHQIGYKEGMEISFTDMYDGAAIKNTMSSATVTLFLEVTYGTTQKDVIVPAVTIWNMEPEYEEITTGLSNVIDNFNIDGTFRERREGLYQKYSLFVDCDARQNSILAILSEIVRIAIGQHIVWVGGKKLYIDFDGKPTEVLPSEGFDIIPKIEYRCKVEVKEDVFIDKVLPKTTENILTVTPN